jgi:hypothetical protein
MTFAAQIRRTVILGLALMALGLAVLGLGRLLSGGVPQGPLALAASAATMAGAVVLVLGVAGRAAQRWLWRSAFARSALTFAGRRYGDYLLSGRLSGLWRWWLHVDLSGNDLDRIG